MASQGSVIVRVYTSDAYLPLANVPVTFSKVAPKGGRTTLAVRLTDSSGLTTPLVVETPDVAASLRPGSALLPYATISISASYPGYNSIQADGVQIFPGVETVQGLKLYPISAGGSDSPVRFDEPGQPL